MKISDDSLEFLTELLETPSPSGFEIDAQRIWADEMRKILNGESDGSKEEE